MDHASDLKLFFLPEDEGKIASKPRTTVYYGPCPWDLRDRSKIKELVGRRVLIEGVGERTLLGMETFAKLPGPRVGESVGLWVRDEHE